MESYQYKHNRDWTVSISTKTLAQLWSNPLLVMTQQWRLEFRKQTSSLGLDYTIVTTTNKYLHFTNYHLTSSTTLLYYHNSYQVLFYININPITPLHYAGDIGRQ